MGELTDKIKGAVKEVLGEAKQHSNDPQTQAEGTVQKIDGKFDKTKGAVKGALGDKI
ncbi:MAG TPA: CsbD family protein [Erythrobacter sp.]|nr:CsbD family protein [Erythrobacter sp.]